jgi:hypothetical protein
MFICGQSVSIRFVSQIAMVVAHLPYPNIYHGDAATYPARLLVLCEHIVPRTTGSVKQMTGEKRRCSRIVFEQHIVFLCCACYDSVYYDHC